MKIGQLKIGERFVLPYSCGVWERVEGKSDCVLARCVFGPECDYGRESTFDPEDGCYCCNKKEEQKAAPVTSEAIKVIVIEEREDKILKEMGHLTQEQILVLSSSDTIRITPQGTSEAGIFMVSEVAYDMGDGVLYVSVLPERKVGRENDEQSRNNVQVKPSEKYRRNEVGKQTRRKPNTAPRRNQQ